MSLQITVGDTPNDSIQFDDPNVRNLVDEVSLKVGKKISKIITGLVIIALGQTALIVSFRCPPCPTCTTAVTFYDFVK